jgi:hypothetical protein
MASTFYIKQGDLLPVLRGRIFDEKTKAGQDLTGATLQFHMKNADTDEVIIAAGVAVVDGNQLIEEEKGMWRYEWQPGDTGPYDPKNPVTFTGEVQADFAGKPLTGPNDRPGFRIIMEAQIA